MLLLLVVSYAGLRVLFFPGFVLDDSYVTYRYALNLVEHGTMAWNPGEDPVEGSTSFLWVVLTVPAIALGIPAALWSSILSIGFMAAVIWSLAGLCRTLPWPDRLVLCGALALSAPMALHSTQGMETAAAAAVVYWVSLCCSRVIRGDRGVASFLLLAALMLAATLLRPEMAIFSAVLTLALAAMLLATDRRALRRLLVGYLPVIAVGLGYFLWRYSYFGYVLPNPAYIKSGSGLSPDGIRMMLNFLLWMVLPVTLYVLYRTRGALRLGPVWPVIVGISALLAYQCTIQPIQGYEFRYQAPVFPAILLCLVIAMRRAPTGLAPLPPRAILLAVLACLLIWPVLRLPVVRAEALARTPADRTAVGRALQGVEGAALFTSEAGALPYFSRWRAYDHLGLTSEEVVHEGLSCALFESWQVDVVMLLVNPAIISNEIYDVPLKCPSMARFEPITATRKTARASHIWYVDSSSPRAAEISLALKNATGVQHLDTAHIVGSLGAP
ncbi:hypothetical protein DYI42_18455 [Vannielia litorea]|nr:hypothetical protein [Vannielia litorea]